jgi:hypothetical protein
MHSVSDVRQIEIDTAKLLLPDHNSFKAEIAVATLKKYKSSGSDQIPVELFQTGGETLLSVIQKLVNSIWNK